MTSRATKPGLRLGIVGTGAMAVQMAQAARSVERLSVSGVLSRNATRASKFCSGYAPEAIACSDISQLFDVADAIYVATPPPSHVTFVEKAIGAGKPILCEKPLTVSSTDTTRLLKAARDARVPLMEAIWTLALPAYREMKRTFGGRQNAILHFDFSYPADASGRSHVLHPDSGGVLIDRSVYGYAAGISLLGDVIQQTAWVTHDDAGLETDAELRLEHSEGARSLISLSIARVGPNLLHVSNGSGLMALGPTSLAAETLRRVTVPQSIDSLSTAGTAALRSRLKASPTLRALKSRLPIKSQFLSYGASSYAPILKEFLAVVEQGRVESEIVPHRLSEQIAHLTEDARCRSMIIRT